MHIVTLPCRLTSTTTYTPHQCIEIQANLGACIYLMFFFLVQPTSLNFVQSIHAGSVKIMYILTYIKSINCKNFSTFFRKSLIYGLNVLESFVAIKSW